MTSWPLSAPTGSHLSRVNLAAIKACAQSHLSRTKNDRLDAALIAVFCLERQPPAWHPPAPELCQLQALIRRLDYLVEMRTMEENRLSSGITVEAVRESVEKLVAHLMERSKRMEALIHAHIDSHPGLHWQRLLLNTITEAGAAMAAVLSAEVTELKEYRSARQGPAFAGLLPREQQLGSSVRGRLRLSKLGNAGCGRRSAPRP